MLVRSRFAAILLSVAATLVACGGEEEAASNSEVIIAELTSGGANAIVAVQNDWGAGYCANVTVKNVGAAAATSWTVVLDDGGAPIDQLWSGSFVKSGRRVTVTPLGWNAALAAGQSTTFGFCASGTGRATLTSVSLTTPGGSGGGGGTTATGGVGGTTATGGVGGTTATGGVGGTTATGGVGGTTATGGAGGTGGVGGTTATGGAGGTGGVGGSTATGGAGGTGGVGGGACVVSAPPAQFETTLNATWREMTGQLAGQGAGARTPSSSVFNFRNSILDQLRETGGTLNYCVRYESTVTLSATNRDKLEDALERNINEWIKKIDGNCSPYAHVPVKVVGWAAMNRATFGWSDGQHPGLMYIGDNSHESAPQCAQACGRFFNRGAGYQYPNCQGGRANHYDMSLWLTEGMNGGAGGDWGQRVGRGYFVGAIDRATIHILSHEMGHGFGFPDYYNWATWVPGVPAPHSIMVAGAATTVTEWDSWMMRRLWSEMRANRGW